MASELASGNPTAIPLLVAGVLFVHCLHASSLAMMRINHVKFARPRHTWIAAQKSYLKRTFAYYDVGILLGIGVFVTMSTNALLVPLISATLTVGWVVLGHRLLGARFMPED